MVKKAYEFFMRYVIGRIEWSSIYYAINGKSYALKNEDIKEVLKLLKSGRYIGLIRRKAHLSTYLISLGHYLMSLVFYYEKNKPSFGHWSHAFIHIEEDDASEIDLQILEAIGSGVIKSDFWNVLNCDSICLLKPKHIDDNEFDNLIVEAKELVGKPYDFVLNINDSSEINCVEYVFVTMLQADPKSLPNLFDWVTKTGFLTPDMLYKSGDFEIVYEVRR